MRNINGKCMINVDWRGWMTGTKFKYTVYRHDKNLLSHNLIILMLNLGIKI